MQMKNVESGVAESQILPHKSLKISQDGDKGSESSKWKKVKTVPTISYVQKVIQKNKSVTEELKEMSDVSYSADKKRSDDNEIVLNLAANLKIMSPIALIPNTGIYKVERPGNSFKVPLYI
jgi:hypothetical protein